MPQPVRTGHGADARADQGRRGRIERGGGLIEQQQPRLVHQRLGERQPRLLARGQYPARVLRSALEIELLQQLLDAWRRPATS